MPSDDLRGPVYADVHPLRLRPPEDHGLPVDRAALIRSLARDPAVRLVTLAAPAGYGKTAFLRQWSQIDGRSVVWLTGDRTDADPVGLLRAVAVAFDRVEPLPDGVFAAVGRTLSVADTALTRLAVAIAASPSPFLMVLDDCHRLSSPESLEVIGRLAEAIPDGSVLVLAGRSTVDLPVGRLRVDGAVRELGPEDLALSRAQARAMLDGAGVRVSEEIFEAVYQRTDGWTAGLQLATMRWRDSSGTGPAPGRTGDLRPGDRYLAEYLDEEVLSVVDPDVLAFLRGAAVLEKMSGPACDAVLDRTGSAALLEELARRRSFFVAPLDDDRHWYQFHRLFGELLRDELRRADPTRFRILHRRASEWWCAEGDVDAAVRHAVAAGDRQRTGDLVLAHTMSFMGRGRVETVGLWLDEIEAGDERWLAESPSLAIAGALYSLGVGDLGRFEQHLGVARRFPEVGPLADGSPSVAVAVAALTAMLGRAGVEQTVRHTTVVREAGRDGNPWYDLASGLEGLAAVLMDDLDGGRALLEEALDGLVRFPQWSVIVLSYLALIAEEEGGVPVAVARIREACSLADEHGLETLASPLLTWSVAASLEARHGDRRRAARCIELARASLAAVGDFRGYVTRLQLMAPLFLAEAHLALGERDVADELCRRAETMRSSQPHATLVLRRLKALRAELSDVPAELTGGVSLTAAERKVLELLPTHASLQEIGDQLFVSRNTVKTHALSVYRKLGVSSRSRAVERARELHLLPAS